MVPYQPHLSIYAEAMLHEKPYTADYTQPKEEYPIQTRWARFLYRLGETMISMGCRLCQVSVRSEWSSSHC